MVIGRLPARRKTANLNMKSPAHDRSRKTRSLHSIFFRSRKVFAGQHALRIALCGSRNRLLPRLGEIGP